MILLPHILVGGAVGSKIDKISRLIGLIILALASHYLLDSLPHYEYQINALKNGLNTDFAVAALKVFFDFSVGLAFLILMGRRQKNFYYILIGGLIAVLPDALIFLNWRMGNLGYLNYLVYLNHIFHYRGDTLIPHLTVIITQIVASAVAIFVLLQATPIYKKIRCS